MALTTGDLVAFTFPVVGGTHTARVIDPDLGDGHALVRVVGFSPLLGDVYPVERDWVHQPDVPVRHRDGLVTL